MRLTKKQQEAIRAMGNAYGLLSSAWSDELGERLHDLGLLPNRCLMEAEADCFHIAEDGKIPIDSEEEVVFMNEWDLLLDRALTKLYSEEEIEEFEWYINKEDEDSYSWHFEHDNQEILLTIDKQTKKITRRFK